jgi:hypothetical protein
MGDDEDAELMALVQSAAPALNMTAADLLDATKSGRFRDEDRARIRRANHRWPVSSDDTWPFPPKVPTKLPVQPSPPAATKPAPAVKPPPVHMRATLRVHFTKFSKDFLPEETVHAMMRNQVVPTGAQTIPEPMLTWCERNCADFWMPSPPQNPEYIMFASEVDMTLFLTAHGGGGAG